MKIKSFIKWLAKLFGVSFEPPFEIIDNLDVFVKDRLNSMLNGAKSFDIATGYFQISGWQAFADYIESLLNTGGKIRLLIGNVSKENLLPQIANFLLHLIKNPQIEARTIKPRLLHAKVFMAKTDKELRLLFGSSNLTTGGMETNIELNTYEVLSLESKKAKSFIEWYEKLWESAVPIDEELKLELILASQKDSPIPVAIEDPNKALFLSLLVKDLARLDLRDIGNFAPLKFQYVDAVACVNRFFFQPGDKRGLMLAHEVGLGKTIISGMILKHLLYHNHIKNALIVAPLSIIRQWLEDLKNKFSIEPVEITSKKLKGFEPKDSMVYLISYDLLREHILDFHKDWDLIIVDESHFIRNSQTLRFKAIKELKSKFYLLLTATPMHNRIEDIATQLFLFVPEEIISKATKGEISKVDRTKLFKTFIKRRLQKKELSEIIPERNVLPPEVIKLSDEERKLYEKLREFLSKDSQYYQIISRSIKYIAPFVKQRYLEELISSKNAALFALDNLRERIKDAINRGFIEYNFSILKKETEGLVADEIRSFVEDELEAQSEIEITRDEEGNLIIRLSIDKKIEDGLQSDIKFLDEIINRIEKIEEFTKFKKVVDRIKDLNPSEDKKIVVFVGFIKTGEKLVEELKNQSIKSGFFYGELEEAQREKLIEKLWSKDEERIDVLICTDAAYVGLNLQIADTIIHHDLSWNPMVVEQRVGRIHRIGQKKAIISHSFLCKDTIDERKHEILTRKLEEISTHLGMSYAVVLSEAAISSEIEKLMAQFELKEIDEEELKEGLKKHITDRKEIFELLEELPSEESEILQVGFTNDLIEKVDEVVREILKHGKKVCDFKVQPIVEAHDFIVLEYKKDGKKVKELSALSDKSLLFAKPETLEKWKKQYEYENFAPSYVGPFHPIVREITNSIINKNFRKFWKKRIGNNKPLVSIYLLISLNIKNFMAGIDTQMKILVPVLYEVESKEIKIDSAKTYELANSIGKIEEMDEESFKLLNEARKELDCNLKNIKDKITNSIEKVKIQIEEIVLEKQRSEIQKKMDEKMRRLESLSREISRKRTSGLDYKNELREANKIKDELNELKKQLTKVPEITLVTEFKDHQEVGGCVYI